MPTTSCKFIRSRSCSIRLEQQRTSISCCRFSRMTRRSPLKERPTPERSRSEAIGRRPGPFQPQNQWVAYTPAFRIKYDVHGDGAHLYFECLYVDKVANKIAVHTNSDDALIRVNGRWLIRDMKAAVVPEL